MSNGGHRAQKVVLIGSLILLLIALGTAVIAVLSPSWQVVDIREFRAQHHVKAFISSFSTVYSFFFISLLRTDTCFSLINSANIFIAWFVARLYSPTLSFIWSKW